MAFNQHSGQISFEDTLTHEQQGSFLSGYSTILLPPGTELWRFVSRQGDNSFGAFWITPETMSALMQRLHYNNNFSQHNKKENIKNSLAILSGWSNVSWRVKVILTKEVTAYIGTTGPQANFAKIENTSAFGGGEMHVKDESRHGSSEQIVIPRFRGLPNSNQYGDVKVFVHI
ncbi:MAG: hypothetical protein ACJAV7_003041 [Flavobacteriales bacterium]|jgi:hypothetical protein